MNEGRKEGKKVRWLCSGEKRGRGFNGGVVGEREREQERERERERERVKV